MFEATLTKEQADLIAAALEVGSDGIEDDEARGIALRLATELAAGRLTFDADADGIVV